MLEYFATTDGLRPVREKLEREELTNGVILFNSIDKNMGKRECWSHCLFRSSGESSSLLSVFGLFAASESINTF